MRAKGVASVLQLVRELRETVEQGPSLDDRDRHIRHSDVVDALWSDLEKLLNEETQREIERFDSWLGRIEEALEAGGDTAKLIELGIRLTDRRAELLVLNAKTILAPRPSQRAIDAIKAMRDMYDANSSATEDGVTRPDV